MLEFALNNPGCTLIISCFAIFSTYYIIMNIVDAITNVRIAKHTGKLPVEEDDDG